MKNITLVIVAIVVALTMHAQATWAQEQEENEMGEEIILPILCCANKADSLFWYEKGDITRDILMDILLDQLVSGVTDSFNNGELLDSMKILKYTNGAMLFTTVEERLTPNSSSEVASLFFFEDNPQESVFFKYPISIPRGEIMEYMSSSLKACEDSVPISNGGTFELRMYKEPVLCADSLKEEEIYDFLCQYPKLLKLIEGFD